MGASGRGTLRDINFARAYRLRLTQVKAWNRRVRREALERVKGIEPSS
jgi:hypothetical protein